MASSSAPSATTNGGGGANSNGNVASNHSLLSASTSNLAPCMIQRKQASNFCFFLDLGFGFWVLGVGCWVWVLVVSHKILLNALQFKLNLVILAKMLKLHEESGEEHTLNTTDNDKSVEC